MVLEVLEKLFISNKANKKLSDRLRTEEMQELQKHMLHKLKNIPGLSDLDTTTLDFDLSCGDMTGICEQLAVQPLVSSLGLSHDTLKAMMLGKLEEVVFHVSKSFRVSTMWGRTVMRAIISTCPPWSRSWPPEDLLAAAAEMAELQRIPPGISRAFMRFVFASSYFNEGGNYQEHLHSACQLLVQQLSIAEQGPVDHHQPHGSAVTLEEAVSSEVLESIYYVMNGNLEGLTRLMERHWVTDKSKAFIKIMRWYMVLKSSSIEARMETIDIIRIRKDLTELSKEWLGIGNEVFMSLAKLSIVAPKMRNGTFKSIQAKAMLAREYRDCIRTMSQVLKINHYRLDAFLRAIVGSDGPKDAINWLHRNKKVKANIKHATLNLQYLMLPSLRGAEAFRAFGASGGREQSGAGLLTNTSAKAESVSAARQPQPKQPKAENDNMLGLSSMLHMSRLAQAQSSLKNKKNGLATTTIWHACMRTIFQMERSGIGNGPQTQDTHQVTLEGMRAVVMAFRCSPQIQPCMLELASLAVTGTRTRALLSIARFAGIAASRWQSFVRCVTLFGDMERLHHHRKMLKEGDIPFKTEECRRIIEEIAQTLVSLPGAEFVLANTMKKHPQPDLMHIVMKAKTEGATHTPVFAGAEHRATDRGGNNRGAASSIHISTRSVVPGADSWSPCENDLKLLVNNIFPAYPHRRLVLALAEVASGYAHRDSAQKLSKLLDFPPDQVQLLVDLAQGDFLSILGFRTDQLGDRAQVLLNAAINAHGLAKAVIQSDKSEAQVAINQIGPKRKLQLSFGMVPPKELVPLCGMRRLNLLSKITGLSDINVLKTVQQDTLSEHLEGMMQVSARSIQHMLTVCGRAEQHASDITMGSDATLGTLVYTTPNQLRAANMLSAIEYEREWMESVEADGTVKPVRGALIDKRTASKGPGMKRSNTSVALPGALSALSGTTDTLLITDVDADKEMEGALDDNLEGDEEEEEIDEEGEEVEEEEAVLSTDGAKDTGGKEKKGEGKREEDDEDEDEAGNDEDEDENAEEEEEDEEEDDDDDNIDDEEEEGDEEEDEEAEYDDDEEEGEAVMESFGEEQPAKTREARQRNSAISKSSSHASIPPSNGVVGKVLPAVQKLLAADIEGCMTVILASLLQSDQQPPSEQKRDDDVMIRFLLRDGSAPVTESQQALDGNCLAFLRLLLKVCGVQQLVVSNAAKGGCTGSKLALSDTHFSIPDPAWTKLTELAVDEFNPMLLRRRQRRRRRLLLLLLLLLKGLCDQANSLLPITHNICDVTYFFMLLLLLGCGQLNLCHFPGVPNMNPQLVAAAQEPAALVMQAACAAAAHDVKRVKATFLPLLSTLTQNPAALDLQLTFLMTLAVGSSSESPGAVKKSITEMSRLTEYPELLLGTLALLRNDTSDLSAAAQYFETELNLMSSELFMGLVAAVKHKCADLGVLPAALNISPIHASAVVSVTNYSRVDRSLSHMGMLAHLIQLRSSQSLQPLLDILQGQQESVSRWGRELSRCSSSDAPSPQPSVLPEGVPKQQGNSDTRHLLYVADAVAAVAAGRRPIAEHHLMALEEALLPHMDAMEECADPGEPDEHGELPKRHMVCLRREGLELMICLGQRQWAAMEEIAEKWLSSFGDTGTRWQWHPEVMSAIDNTAASDSHEAGGTRQAMARRHVSFSVKSKASDLMTTAADIKKSKKSVQKRLTAAFKTAKTRYDCVRSVAACALTHTILFEYPAH
eukprot:gene2566-3320_t